MDTPVEFDLAAQQEFDEAFNWYSKRSAGAAIGFATEVDVAVDSIAADPNRFQRTYAGCRMRRLKRYPYCIVYCHDHDVTRVVAVAHAKRRPGYWRGRL